MTDKDIKYIIENNNNIIIRYSTDWHNPCKILDSLLIDIQKDYEDLVIINADLKKNELLLLEYNIKYIPTCILVKSGKEISRFYGVKSSEEIKKFLEEHTN